MHELEFNKILSEITLPFNLTLNKGKMDTGRYIQIIENKTCNREKDKEYISKGRKWYISEHVAKNELVFTVFKAVDTYMRHEMREQFKYMGKTIFDPHISLEALMSVCDNIETRKS